MKIFSVNFNGYGGSVPKMIVESGITVKGYSGYKKLHYGVLPPLSNFAALDYWISKDRHTTSFKENELKEGDKLKTGYFEFATAYGYCFVPTAEDNDHRAIVFFTDIVKPYTEIHTEKCKNEFMLVTGLENLRYDSKKELTRCPYCGQRLLNITKENVDAIIKKVSKTELDRVLEVIGFTDLELAKCVLRNEYFFHVNNGSAEIATCTKELYDNMISYNTGVAKGFDTAYNRPIDSGVEKENNGSMALVIPEGTSFSFSTHPRYYYNSQFFNGTISYNNGKLSVSSKLMKTTPFYKVEE